MGVKLNTLRAGLRFAPLRCAGTRFGLAGGGISEKFSGHEHG
jgi:hypothetical protein